LNGDGVSRYLVAHQGDHLSNDLVNIDRLPLWSTLVEQEANSTDDLRRAGCVFHHSRRGSARFFHIRALAVEPAQAGVGIGKSGGNWLVHFVCEGSSQLSHRSDPADPCEIRL